MGTGPVDWTARTQVLKSLAPGQAGTVRLVQRFGPTLLQVRYRHDWTGLFRYTTVELLVEAAPVQRGRRLGALYAVRIGAHEKRLQATAKARGGRWHPDLRCWVLTGEAVQALRLSRRVEYVQVRRQPRASPARRG